MKDTFRKFDSKVDECIFIECSSYGRAYKVYNKRSKLLEEFIHINLIKLT